MDPQPLALELQALQRGRGLGRRRVQSWLGPELAALAACEPRASDEVWRRRLTAMLTQAAEDLPPDLRFLFLVASGVASDLPLLKQRLDLAGRRLDRDARTLSRRLRVAEASMAEALLVRFGRRSPFDPQGWTTTAVVSSYDFSDGRALISSLFTLVAERDGDLFEQRLTFPAAPENWSPAIVDVTGATLASLEHVAPVTWCATFAFPGRLTAGEQVTLGFVVDAHDRARLAPFAACAPIAPCAHFDLTVDFGRPSVARQVFLLDGVAAIAAGGAQTPVPPDANTGSVLSLHFDDLLRGMAYGVRWEWAD